MSARTPAAFSNVCAGADTHRCTSRTWFRLIADGRARRTRALAEPLRIRTSSRVDTCVHVSMRPSGGCHLSRGAADVAQARCRTVTVLRQAEAGWGTHSATRRGRVLSLERHGRLLSGNLRRGAWLDQWAGSPRAGRATTMSYQRNGQGASPVPRRRLGFPFDPGVWSLGARFVTTTILAHDRVHARSKRS